MIPLRTIARGEGSRITEPRRVIVRTADDWRVLWALHAGPGTAAPEIDFASTVLAAAFAGEKPSAGHGVEIADAIEEPGGVRLVVTESAPGPGMMAAQIITSPFHIVALPRAVGNVQWSGGEPGIENRDPRSEVRTSALTPRTTDVAPGTSDPAPQTSDLGPRASGLGPRTTGLSPAAAAVLAYLAGPVSGALLLFVEPSRPDVRFHAWQSIIALGGLGLAMIAGLVLAAAAVFVSATMVALIVRVSTAIALLLLIVWAVCLWKAVSGERWKLPLAGEYAERLASSTRPTPAHQAPPTRC